MVFIYDALRLPIGKANGIYKDVIPEVLMAAVLKELTARNKTTPQEIILSNAFGTGGNMGRYAALEAGLPESIPVTTIDFQCAGGLKAVELAGSLIKAGDAEAVIAGGMESRSMAPFKAYKGHDPRFQKTQPFYSIAKFSPKQTFDFTLLKAAENVAIKYQLTKTEMIKWTQKSHQKASMKSSKDALEPYLFKLKETDTDQSIKPETNFESLSSSQFIDRTVSAHYNDGAAAVFLGNEFISRKPLAKILGCFSIGNNPDYAPDAVISATKGLLSKTDLDLSAIDYFEVNESFSIIPLIFAKTFGVVEEKINVLGGNLAYGHPFGASGTINLIHLIATLKQKNAKRGLVVLPAAGGLSTAMIIENVF